MTSKHDPAPGAAPFGLAVFLASLGMLFAASVIAYYAVRVPAAESWGAGLPALPSLLWASTVLLLVSSGTMHIALRGARTGSQRRLLWGLYGTDLLGALFLVLQCVAWGELYQRAGAPAIETLYGMTFYFLTALHAAHVIGGLIPLAVTTWRARAGRYTEESHEGVLLCAMYWHFLDVVWLVLFAVLVVIG